MVVDDENVLSAFESIYARTTHSCCLELEI